MRDEPIDRRGAGVGRQAVIWVTLLLVGVALGGLLGFGSDRGSAELDRPVVAASSEVDGVAVGFPSSCEGAVAAAASYLQAFGSAEIALDLKAARQAVDLLATNGLAVRLRPALAKAIGPYANGAIGTDWRSGIDTLQATVPLAYEQHSCRAEDKASVRIWAVTLRGTAASVWPMQFWDTHQVDLVWDTADWKVSGGWQKPGPVPHWAQTPLPHSKNQEAVMSLARNLRPFRLTP